MIIKTYCKEIDLDDYIHLKFDSEMSMITLVGAEKTEKICFPTKEKAFEFYFEIVEAMYTDKKEIDLEYIQVSYGLVNLFALKDIVAKRIKEYAPDEE